MDPELWGLYLKLQTSTAYPPEFLNQLLWPTEAAIEGALRLYRSLFRQVPETLLVIGPGGVNEIEALRRLGVRDLYAVTAHEEEADQLAARAEPGPDLRVDWGDIHELPLRNGAATTLYASNILEHAFAPYIALMECRRVLVEGGLAYFVMPSFEGPDGGIGPYHLHCLTEPVWSELLAKVGLPVQEYKQWEGDRSTGAYYHCFICRAETPPVPHAGILAEVAALKAWRLI